MNAMHAAVPAGSGSDDPYRLHRLALLPLHTARADSAALEAIRAAGPEHFFDFLLRQGLSQIWRSWLDTVEWPRDFTPHRTALREHAQLTAAHQMRQRNALTGVAELLSRQDIPWFLFKGADLREWLYADPVLRPVSDLDLFIGESERAHAIAALVAAGWQVHVDPVTDSHEVTLFTSEASIDLHWHLLRPGRARPGFDAWLFDHREIHAGRPGLDATASLFVMLVHPAITKYLLSPTSLLIHQVDQARLIGCSRVDWIELGEALDQSGLRTAAWSSLYALRELAGIEAPPGLIERIRPSALHRWYLRQWIDRAWIARWFDHRWLVAGLFNLALQDSPGDALRAFRCRG